MATAACSPRGTSEVSRCEARDSTVAPWKKMRPTDLLLGDVVLVLLGAAA